MEKKLYDEMRDSLDTLGERICLADKSIFLFGHCNATLELADLLLSRSLKVCAILDNSTEKQGLEYNSIPVVLPEKILVMSGNDPEQNSIVLITSRFYSAMARQLRKIGFTGPICKLIDYNTYAEYSTSEETVTRMRARERHGAELLKELSGKYAWHFKVFCPFNAIGDIFFMISYWPVFAARRGIDQTVFCVPNKVLTDVIHMFGDYPVEVYDQKELDAMIQAVVYTQDPNSFIAHQDRPYVINLHRALYIKKIPLEKIYCCGVYGLPADTVPSKPRQDLPVYKDIEAIPDGKAVIFSPYAKSVPAIDPGVWKEAVGYYNKAGYKCYTNVVGDETALEDTEAISPSILEMRSVMERAGTFIGIRSGLCDILREAECKKIALYPDYNYSDTKCKAIEIYYIEQFDHNLLATEEIEWENL